MIIGSLDGDPGLDLFIANDLSSNHFWTGVREPDFQLRESAILPRTRLGRSIAGPGFNGNFNR